MRLLSTLLLLTLPLTACVDTTPAQPLKPEPYTYVSPPEPRSETAAKPDSTYVPPPRDPTATPYPQW